MCVVPIRSFIFALAAIIVTSTAASAASQGKRIALLTTANTNAYMGVWTATFLKAAEPFGLQVRNLTSPFDPALQSQQIDDAVAQHVDLIMLVTINQQAVKPALVRAKAAGIPVVLVVNPQDQENQDLFLSFIGVDQRELGRLAGENVKKALSVAGKDKAQVAVITGTASMLNAIWRLEGFKQALSERPDIKIVAQEDGKWNTALSEKIAGDLMLRFNSRGGLDAIYAMADNQVSGVIRAAEDAGAPLGTDNKGLIAIGSNCMAEGIAHIRDGSQFATNTQIPTEEAKFAAQRVADLFNGQTLKKDELVPAHAITKANVDEFAQGCSY
jgi:ribose transport system substrate-binding protein